jgi:hypothetical protein
MKLVEMSISKRRKQPMGDENFCAVEIGCVATGSRLVALWLRHIGGYHVSSLRCTPQAGLFGGIRYQNVWVLRPRGDVGKR